MNSGKNNCDECIKMLCYMRFFFIKINVFVLFENYWENLNIFFFKWWIIKKIGLEIEYNNNNYNICDIWCGN